MTIDGREVDSPGHLAVVDPATGVEIGLAPDCTREQLDEAMASAQAAFASWSRDPAGRTAAMLACADALEANRDELAELSTREQGMPITDARWYVERGAVSLRRYAALELTEETIEDSDAIAATLSWHPVGVVAAVKPWNVPLTMAISTIAPAFRAGCTVVLKPSPYTPLATLLLGRILARVLPPGVLNVVSGRDPLGQWMVEHRVPRGVSFTGSVATGKRVNAAAGADLKRVLLELGGNDPAIVLDDADPDWVADQLLWPVFLNSGQVCKAIKRIFAPRATYPRIVEALAARARDIAVGPGLDESVRMGPVNNRPQLERVAALVDGARAAGAQVVAGGRAREGEGLFYEPTVVADVAEGVPLVDDEQFGPVVPVLVYDSLDEAVERANATTYGLGASVWSPDLERAGEVARRLEAGTVWVNAHGPLGAGHPFAGVKWSGVGVAGGLWGVRAYCDPRVVHVVKTPVAKTRAAR